MTVRTSAHVRADISAIRESFERINAKAAPTTADVNDLRALDAQLTDLLAEHKTLKEREERAKGERQQMASLFSGDVTPTSDGTRQTRAADRPGLASVLKQAGWDLQTNPAVRVSLFDAAGLSASVTTTDAPASTWQPRRVADEIFPLGRDRRYLWPFLRVETVEDETSIEDFRQEGSRTITGDIERAIGATTDKAQLSVSLVHVTTALKTLAIMADGVPVQLLRSLLPLSEFLNGEMQYAIDAALDAHVMSQIEAASPPSNSTAGDLFTRVRNAIATMRSNGAAPDLLVLNPTDSAALDLLADNEARYYFGPPARTGMANTLWDLRVVERTSADGDEAPMLIDSTRIGQLYLGMMRFEADPFSGFKKNLVSLRLEANALFNVRDKNAAYVLEAAA